VFNELTLLCGRTFTEAAPESPCSERGGSLGVRAGGGAKCPRAGHSGPQIVDVGTGPGLISDGCAGVGRVGTAADFHRTDPGRETENLKT
jgi:hypothetical protein